MLVSTALCVISNLVNCENESENDFEDKNEERMTHVLILYFRYFAHTNLAATILLFVEIVIML